MGSAGVLANDRQRRRVGFRTSVQNQLSDEAVSLRKVLNWTEWTKTRIRARFGNGGKWSGRMDLNHRPPGPELGSEKNKNASLVSLTGKTRKFPLSQMSRSCPEKLDHIPWPFRSHVPTTLESLKIPWPSSFTGQRNSAALSHCATEGLKCVSVLACSTFHVRRLLMRRQLADEATVVLNTAHAVGCRVTAVGAVERRLPLGLGECLRLGFEERWAAVARAESPAPEQWAG